MTFQRLIRVMKETLTSQDSVNSTQINIIKNGNKAIVPNIQRRSTEGEQARCSGRFNLLWQEKYFPRLWAYKTASFEVVYVAERKHCFRKS